MTKRKKIIATIVLILSVIILIMLLCVSCGSNENDNIAGDTVETGALTEAGVTTQAPLETATDAVAEESTEDKPGTTTESDKPEASTGASQPTTTAEALPPSSEDKPATTESVKPQATTQAEALPPSTTEATTQEVTTEATTEATTQHSHNWVEVTVEHPAETHEETQSVCVQEAYYSTEWAYDANVCNNCGFVDYPVGWSGMTIGEHCLMCAGKNDKGFWIGTSYHSQPFYEEVYHEAVYEDQTIVVVDKEAWTETYYECSLCGATKE